MEKKDNTFCTQLNIQLCFSPILIRIYHNTRAEFCNKQPVRTVQVTSPLYNIKRNDILVYVYEIMFVCIEEEEEEERRKKKKKKKKREEEEEEEEEEGEGGKRKRWKRKTMQVILN